MDQLFLGRELGGLAAAPSCPRSAPVGSGAFPYASGFSYHLARKLKLARTLEAHYAHVNWLSYDSTGRLLVTAGDDCTLRIWDASSGGLLRSFDPGHTNSLLCADFLPHAASGCLITAAADKQVRIVDLQRQAVRPLLHHQARVRALAAASGSVFLSADEDGAIWQSDARAPPPPAMAGGSSGARRRQLGDGQHQLVDQKSEGLGRVGSRVSVTSISIHPLQPDCFATGGGDSLVRVYDMRMLAKPGSGRRGFMSALQPAWCYCYIPEHLRRPAQPDFQRRQITGVSFSPDGQQLLASYSHEHIYSFSREHSRSYDQVFGRARATGAAQQGGHTESRRGRSRADPSAGRGGGRGAGAGAGDDRAERGAGDAGAGGGPGARLVGLHTFNVPDLPLHFLGASVRYVGPLGALLQQPQLQPLAAAAAGGARMRAAQRGAAEAAAERPASRDPRRPPPPEPGDGHNAVVGSAEPGRRVTRASTRAASAGVRPDAGGDAAPAAAGPSGRPMGPETTPPAQPGGARAAGGRRLLPLQLIGGLPPLSMFGGLQVPAAMMPALGGTTQLFPFLSSLHGRAAPGGAGGGGGGDAGAESDRGGGMHSPPAAASSGGSGRERDAGGSSSRGGRAGGDSDGSSSDDGDGGSGGRGARGARGTSGDASTDEDGRSSGGGDASPAVQVGGALQADPTGGFQVMLGGATLTLPGLVPQGFGGAHAATRRRRSETPGRGHGRGQGGSGGGGGASSADLFRAMMATLREGGPALPTAPPLAAVPQAGPPPRARRPAGRGQRGGADGGAGAGAGAGGGPAMPRMQHTQLPGNVDVFTFTMPLPTGSDDAGAAQVLESITHSISNWFAQGGGNARVHLAAGAGPLPGTPGSPAAAAVAGSVAPPPQHAALQAPAAAPAAGGTAAAGAPVGAVDAAMPHAGAPLDGEAAALPGRRTRRRTRSRSPDGADTAAATSLEAATQSTTPASAGAAAAAPPTAAPAFATPAGAAASGSGAGPSEPSAKRARILQPAPPGGAAVAGSGASTSSGGGSALGRARSAGAAVAQGINNVVTRLLGGMLGSVAGGSGAGATQAAPAAGRTVAAGAGAAQRPGSPIDRPAADAAASGAAAGTAMGALPSVTGLPGGGLLSGLGQPPGSGTSPAGGGLFSGLGHPLLSALGERMPLLGTPLSSVAAVSGAATPASAGAQGAGSGQPALGAPAPGAGGALGSSSAAAAGTLAAAAAAAAAAGRPVRRRRGFFEPGSSDSSDDDDDGGVNGNTGGGSDSDDGADRTPYPPGVERAAPRRRAAPGGSDGDDAGVQRGYRQKFVGHLNESVPKNVCWMGRHSELVVSGSDCGNLLVWDAASGAVINVLHGGNQAVTCVKAHPHETALAAAATEPIVRLWGADGGTEPDQAHADAVCASNAANAAGRPDRHRLLDMLFGGALAGMMSDVLQEMMGGAPPGGAGAGAHPGRGAQPGAAEQPGPRRSTRPGARRGVRPLPHSVRQVAGEERRGDEPGVAGRRRRRSPRAPQPGSDQGSSDADDA